MNLKITLNNIIVGGIMLKGYLVINYIHVFFNFIFGRLVILCFVALSLFLFAYIIFEV